MYVCTVVFFNLKNSENFVIINYKIKKGKGCAMTKKQLIEVLDEFDMDEELDMNEVEFVSHFRRQEQIPRTYAEIEYDDFDSEEAAMGARFDNMNFLRYFER